MMIFSLMYVGLSVYKNIIIIHVCGVQSQQEYFCRDSYLGEGELHQTRNVQCIYDASEYG
jgi:uncharacterized protein YbcI